jgi:hypothetical protein
LADVLSAALRSHLQFPGSVAQSSHNDLTGNGCAYTKLSQSASRREILLVAELYLFTEKLSALAFAVRDSFAMYQKRSKVRWKRLLGRIVTIENSRSLVAADIVYHLVLRIEHQDTHLV